MHNPAHTQAMLHTTYLSLGSNLGNREQNLRTAIAETENRIGHVVAQSDFIVTSPVGFQSDNNFLNAAIQVLTALSPMQLLTATQQIERDMGRLTKSINQIYHDRTIDIDILTYDDLILQSPQLTIPHPRITTRDFVLRPLSQIAPQLIIPGQSRTVETLERENHEKNIRS